MFNITLATKWGVDYIRAIRRNREIFREIVPLLDEIKNQEYLVKKVIT